jgi:hypothetical protein
MAFNSFERETVYREYSCARWNYWTYLEGRRYSISRKQYETYIRQGAKSVLVK